MRILTGFRGEIARFVILKARCQRVNHLHVPLCPEVTHLRRQLLGGRSGGRHTESSGHVSMPLKERVEKARIESFACSSPEGLV